ncbi:MAG: hypothetical protein IPJ81_10960 [Chitinophagaceae bacterium]|nr:hypothetical protein [Chitinophagaceae bacterium]
MKQHIVFTILIFTFFISCTSNDTKEGTPKAKDKYELTKENLEEVERKNPERFLTVSASDKKNLLGQTVVKVIIANNAKVCIYKDVDIQLSFYSKTGTLLEEDKETIYESLSPGSSTNHKTKYFAPKGTSNIIVKVVGSK